MSKKLHNDCFTSIASLLKQGLNLLHRRLTSALETHKPCTSGWKAYKPCTSRWNAFHLCLTSSLLQKW